MEPLLITGESLKVDDVVAVANGRRVELSPDVLPQIKRSRRAVETLVNEKRVAYGITTGFGHFKDKIIPPEEVKQLQLNLVRSHAVGVGPALSREAARAMLLVRANTLAKGFSGVRPVVITTMLDILNADIYPRILSQGSLGASGDLAPLAHLGMVLLGEGEVFVDGEAVLAADVFAKHGIQPLELQAKEGLAILNGTTMMVGLGALLVRRGINLLITADIAACLSLEALKGTDRAYDHRVHAVRPHPRQADCAAFLRKLLEGSQFLRDDDPLNVQDPYTLRCVPQVHGAVRDAVAYAQWVIDIELNAVNDNPIIFTEEGSDEFDVISAGNFHGEPIAFAADYMKLALTDLGNMSERRIARLVDADCNQSVLPMFLTEYGGLQSGFMIAQYTAASLASENKSLAHPASADSIPSSANTEDHVSMGAIAVRNLEKVLNHVEHIVSIELMAAAHGIDFRRKRMGRPDAALGAGTSAAYACLREAVPFVDEDVYFAPLMQKVKDLVESAEIKLRVEQTLEGAD